MRNHLLEMTKLGTALTLILFAAATGWAQTTAELSGDNARNEIRANVLERIDSDRSLNAEQRRQMAHNLDRSIELGMSPAQIEGLFPMGGRQAPMAGGDLLRLQERVFSAKEDGIPMGLLVDKVREGRMKRANPAAIERAVNQMYESGRAMLGAWNQAVEGGVLPVGGMSVSMKLQRGMTLDMWRGLRRDEIDHIRDAAVDRAMRSNCSTLEFAAAAETATELIELGMERGRAVEMVSSGLGHGYDARELREVSQMARAVSGSKGGTSRDEMYQWMHQSMQQGDHTEAMMQQMMSFGWMGPRDMHSPGGYSPVDDVMGGPGNHHDARWGDGDHMGGDGHPGGDGHHGGGGQIDGAGSGDQQHGGR